MTAAPHNAPQYILDAMKSNPCNPLFFAASKLGGEMTWMGTPPTVGTTQIDGTFTCWSLDGGKTHATHGEIMKAAGLS
jgi:hypothetical protein